MIHRSEIQIRDPFILTEGDCYYLFGTTDADPWKEGRSFLCWRSRDLEHYEGPYTAFAPGADFEGTINFWAPEVHKVGMRFYMFASFLRPGKQRGTMILASDSPIGPYVPVSGETYTPGDWSCLDGTFFEEDGKLYSFFIHEWTQISDGTVELAQLKADFPGMVSAPVTLFRGSDAPWARAMWNGGYVTDGPFIWKLESGRLAMLWSGFGAEGYTLGVAYSDGGVHGPWVQDPEPLFRRDGGHGMIFRTLEGRLMLTLHSPNETPLERPYFFPLEERVGKLRLDTKA